jgi:hypothetical protein
MRASAALLVLAATGTLAAQEPPGADSAVALVRARVAAIQRARLDSSVLAFTNPGGSGTVAGFREGAAVRKIVARFDGDGASWRLEHYYWDDSLIFAFRRWERFPEEGPARVSEQRWYVAAGRVVRGLDLAEDGRRRTRRPRDADFAREADAVLRAAACWRRYAAAGVEGESAC